jgi:PST family polysaccharide transporter
MSLSPDEPAKDGDGELADKAVRGALWVTLLGLATRVLSLFGTITVTYFLDRQTMGEVAGAAILALSANQFSSLGVPNFLSTRRTRGAALLTHALLLSVLLGVLVLGATAALGPWLEGPLQAPRLARYLPWLSLSALLTRVSQIPEVLLQRELAFRRVAIRRALGELSYTLLAVGLAALGAGGWAIVAGSLGRAALQLVLLSLAVSPARWVARTPCYRADLRAVLTFGLPITAAIAGSVIARQWDNLFVSAQFGAAVMAAYGLAYNLADVPAVQVTEQVGEVLAPSMAKASGAQKKEAIVRLLSALALIVYPLALGLASTAETLTVLFRAEWASVAPLVRVLALMALFRPLGWTI